MSLDIFLLVIFAATLHATWNFISKKAAGAAGDFVFAYRLLATLFYSPLVAYLLWIGGMPWNGTVALFIILTSLLHLGYSLTLQWGYRVADLSVVYPIARGTGPTLSSIGAIILLGEHPSGMSALGIICVVGGVLLITSDGRLRQFATPQNLKGIYWGLLVGLFIAAYTVVDAYSVKTLLIAPIILNWLTALGSVVLLAPRQVTRINEMASAMQGRWRYAAIVGILSPLAYILILYAYKMGGDVSIIAPLRETSMMMGVLAGFFWLREQPSTARILGCAVIIGGVVLLVSHQG